MRYRFADITIDDDTRQMWRDGSEVHLGPKAFDLLMLLIRARPRVLSKSELHTQLWPDSFVSDASLTTLMSEIRGALGERGAGLRVLRTVHRRGYAFAGDVMPLDAAAGPAAQVSYWLQAELRQIGLLAAENIVGRDPHVHVWLDSDTVSRRHACIAVDGGRVTIEDLGSKNGTFVNDQPVAAPVVLTDGDDIRFGSVGVTFRVWTADTSTRSAHQPSGHHKPQKKRR